MNSPLAVADFASSFAEFTFELEDISSVSAQGITKVLMTPYLFRFCSQLGIIRLWELRQIYLECAEPLKSIASKKFLWKSIEWWDEWGRDDILLKDIK